MSKMSEGNMYIKPKDQSFVTFIWNSEKKEFLGRTGTSWAKISIFYVIFYACLAGFFAAMLAIFYQTLDTEDRPKYAYGSSILANPALGFRPRPKANNIESTLIWIKNNAMAEKAEGKIDNKQNEHGNKSNAVKYDSHWVSELTNFMEDYIASNDNATTNPSIRTCNFTQYRQEKEQKENGTFKPDKVKKYCEFQYRWLRYGLPKDGVTLGKESFCSKEQTWGYKQGSPCVLLKMNRIMDWEPDVYTKEDVLAGKVPDIMPKSLKKLLNDTIKRENELPELVWLSCEGENPADKEYLPEIKMLPYHGFPAYFFPYNKNPNYKSPVVAVQFTNPRENVLINIECRIWAKNVKHDSQNRLGMVHFELLID